MWEEKVVDGPHLTQDIPMISIETLLDYSNVHIIPHPIRGMYPQVGLQTCTNLLGHLGMFFQFFPCREAPRIVKSWEERPKFPGFDQMPRGGPSNTPMQEVITVHIWKHWIIYIWS